MQQVTLSFDNGPDPDVTPRVLDLHDVPDACLARLLGLIDAARARGMQFVSELPGECAPIVDGRVVADLRGLMS